MIATLVTAILPMLLILAAISDAATMTIPNRISLAIAGAFFVLGPIVLPLQEFAWHLSTGGAMLLAGVAMFALRWIGGGDAKVFAATALWMGWGDLTSFIAFTAVFGGVLTLSLMALRNVPFVPASVMDVPWAARLLKPNGDIPYGLALAAGGLAAWPQAAMISSAFGFPAGH